MREPLDALEFLRRFLQHTLPSGFMRIRHYGFLSNRSRRDKLPLVRKLLAETQEPTTAPIETPEELTTDPVQPERSDRCPVCNKGRMRLVEEIEPDLKFQYDLACTLVPPDTS